VLRVGVSACLLGQEVRYDGGHKRDRFLSEALDGFVEWAPVCSELEVGMGVPRPALRLVQGAGVELREIASGTDHTRAMQRFAARRVRALQALGLDGYVLKKGSPSCGMVRVKIYPAPDGRGMPRHDRRGLFAQALLDACPSLPVEEEGRLQDARLRENFIERLFAHARLRALFAGRWTPGQVVAFHTAHKLQVMAHSTEAYRALGRAVAAVKSTPRAAFREAYARDFMAALGVLATRGRNANVLQHAAGYLRTQLVSAARQDLAHVIHDYRKGLVPLVVPIALLGHHVRCLDIAYLSGQTYLEPHPRELMLRNHV